MEDLFLYIEKFFNHQIDRSIFISTLVGGIVVLLGAILMMISIFYRHKGEKVTAKVVSIAQETEIDKKTKERSVMFRPKFLILTEPYIGLTIHSSSSSSHCKHDIGDIVYAYFFSSRNEIASETQVKQGIIFGWVFIFLGILMMTLFRFLKI